MCGNRRREQKVEGFHLFRVGFLPIQFGESVEQDRCRHPPISSWLAPHAREAETEDPLVPPRRAPPTDLPLVLVPVSILLDSIRFSRLDRGGFPARSRCCSTRSAERSMACIDPLVDERAQLGVVLQLPSNDRDLFPAHEA